MSVSRQVIGIANTLIVPAGLAALTMLAVSMVLVGNAVAQDESPQKAIDLLDDQADRVSQSEFSALSEPVRSVVATYVASIYRTVMYLTGLVALWNLPAWAYQGLAYITTGLLAGYSILTTKRVIDVVR